MVCAACPVFGADGRVVAGMSVTGRAERLDLPLSRAALLRVRVHRRIGEPRLKFLDARLGGLDLGEEPFLLALALAPLGLQPLLFLV